MLTNRDGLGLEHMSRISNKKWTNLHFRAMEGLTPQPAPKNMSKVVRLFAAPTSHFTILLVHHDLLCRGPLQALVPKHDKARHEPLKKN